MADVHELAARLTKAVTERTAIEPLSDDVSDLDLETGYAVQRVLREQAGPRVGWKLGVTSRAKQAQVGVSDPVFGFLPGTGALDLGEPLRTGELIQPRAEPEIVFADGPRPRGRARHRRPTCWARPRASRWASRSSTPGSATTASRWPTSSPTTPRPRGSSSAARCRAAGVDVRLVGVLLEKNGELVATASGAASLGHPAAAVAWLVRRLAASGEGLAAGEVDPLRRTHRRHARRPRRRRDRDHRPSRDGGARLYVSDFPAYRAGRSLT